MWAENTKKIKEAYGYKKEKNIDYCFGTNTYIRSFVFFVIRDISK